MTRLTISVNDDEFVRLVQMANQEMRHPREQARYILRRVLFGESPPTDAQQQKTTSVVIEGPHAGVSK